MNMWEQLMDELYTCYSGRFLETAEDKPKKTILRIFARITCECHIGEIIIIMDSEKKYLMND